MSVILGRLALLSLLLAGTAPAQTTPSEEPARTSAERLFAAAQRGETETVRELIAAGVDVDSRTRYGATALSYAADHGYLEIIDLLLEAGADPSMADDFYGFTPLTMTLMKRPLEEGHVAVAIKLIEAAAAGVDRALQTGVQMGRIELVRAALASGRVEAPAVRRARAEAERRGLKRLVEIIDSSGIDLGEEPAVIELTAAELEPLAGVYRNAQFEVVMRVFVEDGTLMGQVQGQGSFSNRPIGKRRFTAVEVPDVELEFAGRAGTVERMILRQMGQEIVFTPHAGAFETEPSDTSTAAPDVSTDRGRELRIERTAAMNWPGFRGAGASGIGDGQGVPLEWDGPSGKNVRWKTAIPGLGLSSPIVWGDRLFVTTAVREGGEDGTFRTGLYGDVDSVDDASVHSWKVYALDKRTGEIVWERVAATGVPKVKRHLKSSHANPTPVTDGRHLVVNFGSEGLFCYDLDGELEWRRDLGVLNSGWFYDPTYEWGFSSSPILHRGRVVLQVDIQRGSHLVAYDVETGNEIWRTERDEIPTWGTPAILPGPEDEEIVTNGPTIRGYSFATGEELWRLGPNSEVTVATPVVAGGLAIVTANYPPARPIYAIRPGGRGDLSLADGETSSDHIAWSHGKGGVYIPTPIAYRHELYALQMNGRLTSYDLESGEVIYRQRIGQADSFSGSAVAADGRIYFTTETGETFVIRAGRRFELLAENELDEVVMTTPAISDGAIFIRTLRHLWALAEGDGALPLRP